MNPQDVADVIDAMANSLRSNPAQFQIELHIRGLQVTSHGGVGMISSAVGGGPGSTTIGTKATVDNASVEIKTKQAMDGQIQVLAGTLDTISRELRSQLPNKFVIEGAYRSMVGTWVPGVITSVIGSMISKDIGLTP